MEEFNIMHEAVKAVAMPGREDSRQRLRAFWAGESCDDSPALGIQVRLGDSGPSAKLASLPAKERDWLPEWQVEQYRATARNTRYLGELFPGHHAVMARFLALPAVLAGGDYDEDPDNVWIREDPRVFDQEPPAFDPAHPRMRSLEQCYDALKGAVAATDFVTPPLMLDGLTTLSMLMGCDRLCEAIVDKPSRVQAWAGALNDLYMGCYEHIYRRLGYGRSLCFFGPMAEGRSEGVQCDFSVMLSPEMFQRFVLPDLRRVTDYMDYSLYHLDGTCQMRFLDLLRQCPKLNGIQWNPEPMAGSPLQWLDALREIRRRKFSLYLFCSVDDAVALVREFGPEGLYLQLPAFNSLADAEAALRKFGRRDLSIDGVQPGNAPVGAR
jgi:hypothetical protein